MPGTGGPGVQDEWPTRLRLGFGRVDVRYTGPEAPETIAARVRKALRYVPVPQRSLKPDCGFAPGGTNPIPLDETYAKPKASAAAAARLRAEVGASDLKTAWDRSLRVDGLRVKPTDRGVDRGVVSARGA